MCLFLSFLPASAQASTYYFYTPFTECKVSASDILLSEGTNVTAYAISMNKTWIEVNETGALSETYYEYTINITNLSTGINCTVKLENDNVTGISRLTNFTAYFQDDEISEQVEIFDGSMIQPSGSWYALPASSTIFVSTAIQVSTLGNSIVDLRLHIVANETASPEIIQTITINVN